MSSFPRGDAADDEEAAGGAGRGASGLETPVSRMNSLPLDDAAREDVSIGSQPFPSSSSGDEEFCDEVDVVDGHSTRHTAPKANQITPLPRLGVTVIAIVMFIQSVNVSLLWPFIGFLVEDLLQIPATQVGYYAGYLASAYFISQCFGGYVWGWFADRYGRKPVLICGMLVSGTTTLALGFSFHYVWAIAVRALCGLLNSTPPAAKTYLGDITDSTNRAKGFSIFGVTWGAGMIVGPFFGGVLSRPTQWSVPHVSQDGLLGPHGFPYLIPCYLGGVAALVAAVLVLFLLEESHPKLREKKRMMDEDEDDESYPMHRLDGTDMDDIDVDGSEYPRHQVDGEETSLVASKHVQLHEELVEEEMEELEELEEDILMDEHARGKSLEELNGSAPSSVWMKVMEWRSLVASVACYLIAANVFIWADEVFPIWAIVSPRDGGLGLSSSTIGWMLLCGGIALIGLQIVLYPWLARKLGLLLLIRIGYAGACACVCMYPSAHILVNTSTALTYIWMTLLVVGRSMFGSICFTTSNILVNNAAGANSAGRVNGIAFALAGFFKALGPSVGSNLLAWSLHNHMGFPFDYWFSFLVAGAVALLGIVFTLFISKDVAAGR